MTTYKLTYFNITGLGEPIRFLLSYGKVEFEDNRVERELWPNLRPSMPFGLMPVLEINGKQTHQSVAIARYLGKQFGIAGSNDWEALQIDIIADTFNDLCLKIVAYNHEPDEELKQKKRDPLINETMPYYLSRLDAIVKENNGYFANGKLSWVDMYVVAQLDYFYFALNFDMFEKYPNLRRVKDNVLNLPQIKEWIAKRPKTEK